jgi:hypothetical protein
MRSEGDDPEKSAIRAFGARWAAFFSTTVAVLYSEMAPTNKRGAIEI